MIIDSNVQMVLIICLTIVACYIINCLKYVPKKDIENYDTERFGYCKSPTYPRPSTGSGMVHNHSPIEEKGCFIDSISDLIREYWITTGMKDDGVRKLADKLQNMADKIQIDEFNYQIDKEGIKLFSTHWEDMFGELSEEFWKKYREDK